VFLVVSWADSSPAISHHAGAHSAGPRAFFLLPGDSVGARAGGFFFPWGLLAVLHAASVFFLTGRRLTTGSDFVVSRRNRPERLKPRQVMFILRLARRHGCHDALDWLLADLDYAPTTPIEPRDEGAELQRAFVSAKDELAGILARMEALQARQDGAS